MLIFILCLGGFFILKTLWYFLPLILFFLIVRYIYYLIFPEKKKENVFNFNFKNYYGSNSNENKEKVFDENINIENDINENLDAFNNINDIELNSNIRLYRTNNTLNIYNNNQYVCEVNELSYQQLNILKDKLSSNYKSDVSDYKTLSNDLYQIIETFILELNKKLDNTYKEILIQMLKITLDLKFKNEDNLRNYLNILGNNIVYINENNDEDYTLMIYALSDILQIDSKEQIYD